MTRAMETYLRKGLKGTAFCPGCGHGILLNCLLRAVDRLGIDRRELLFVSGIGCAAWIPSPNIGADTLHTLHGRAVAFATGAKLANPKLTTIVVSGDGDLSSIGGNHLIHAARRNADLTVICANNQIYGMTGGQTASTTPLGARTATDPAGNVFRPFDICRLVMAAGARYAARFPVTRPRLLIDAIERAVRTPGFAFVEAVTPCPTQYGRRNVQGDLPELYAAVDAACVDEAAARAMTEEERLARFVVGEFVP
ncbi:MAG: thiamine pyrophosphate-dependent enzyme [Deltaproteobacteria bacterium]|nr:thiamine pyrophosphate-dependent enzyme [Deltaproteobacteria bacterium]